MVYFLCKKSTPTITDGESTFQLTESNFCIKKLLEYILCKTTFALSQREREYF